MSQTEKTHVAAAWEALIAAIKAEALDADAMFDVLSGHMKHEQAQMTKYLAGLPAHSPRGKKEVGP